MAQIRADFDGTVFTTAGPLVAGDVIPDGVHVGGHLTEDGKAVNAPVALVLAVAPVLDDAEPLTDDETASAEALGLLTDGIHPEGVRGTLVGYAQGWDDAVAELAKEQAETAGDTGEQIEGQGELVAFDPTDHVAVDVHEYIAAHPDEKDAVLALEVAGKNRSSLLAKYTS